MADSRHLAILEQGVTAWNKWRHKNPRTKPDLSGADLRQTPLAGVDFVRDKPRVWAADLHGANVAHANLSGMNLRAVNFREADLSGAYLREAVLIQNRNLRGANLTEANLVRANLRLADLTDAILKEANLGMFEHFRRYPWVLKPFPYRDQRR